MFAAFIHYSGVHRCNSLFIRGQDNFYHFDIALLQTKGNLTLSVPLYKTRVLAENAVVH